MDREWLSDICVTYFYRILTNLEAPYLFKIVKNFDRNLLRQVEIQQPAIFREVYYSYSEKCKLENNKYFKALFALTPFVIL